MLAEHLGPIQLAELASQKATLSARTRPGEWPRLRTIVAGHDGSTEDRLDVDVTLSRGTDGLAVVSVQVDGVLSLTCQRCLGGIRIPIDVDVVLAAVPTQERADGLEDPFDSVLLDEDGGLALRNVVEDEVLAGLPIAPLHDNATCAAAPAGSNQAVTTAIETTRPFAALGELLGRGQGR
ncbi:MAG: hypothetical protein FJ197_03765 [Gammaproteobacteria bacterium]|nr:hypothetical protein [Gammaproteobacteria bacterium]